MKVQMNSCNLHGILKLIKCKSIEVVDNLLYSTIYEEGKLSQRVEYKVDDAAVITNGSTSIPASLIANIPADKQITIEAECITWEGGSVKFKSTGDVVEKLNNFNQVLEIEPDDFKHVCECLSATAKDNIRPVFQCIYIHEDSAVALDGFRMCIRKLKNVNSPGVLIPSKLIKTFNKLKLKESEVTILENNDHVQLNVGRYSLVADRIVGEFINYKSIIPNESTTILKVDAKEFIKVLKKLPKTYLIFDMGEKLTLISKSDDMLLSQDFEAEIEGSPLRIAFNPKYVIDSLKDHNGMVAMNFTNSVSPMLIKLENNLELVSPIRLKEEV